ncbi:hypothetical protein [Citrobacter freundii]|uniref:hypothetical protein n=1 Tax=Citrobacter freundii TaxID=546 RepID=UPI0015E9E768|nr:hypothetical protein [Citrobacter freundii]QLU14959.1 hypothetical protein HV147_14145 [Citrobacter freundii]QLU15533.1 hypothetical protein HV147_17270 [Citrobacter freundii]HEE9902642.1 hypothetical protein [Citrobacter freundii]
MTTNNHPAHGPVSLDRLHQIREILSKAAAQSDGGNLGYAMADAVKVIDGAIAAFGVEPVAWWTGPEPTPTGEIESIHDHETGSHSIPLYPFHNAPPAPVVPDEIQKLKDGRGFKYVKNGIHYSVNYANGWNQCRAATLQAGNHTEQHLDMVDHSGDTHKMVAGNSPVIGVDLASGPDRTVEVRYVAPPGYVMVPKEMTDAIGEAIAMQANCCGGIALDIYDAMLAAAPQQEVKSALEHGMRRYAGAMQKLSEGDD